MSLEQAEKHALAGCRERQSNGFGAVYDVLETCGVYISTEEGVTL